MKHLDKQSNDVGIISDIEKLIEEIYRVGDFSMLKGQNEKNLKDKEVNIVKNVLDNLRVSHTGLILFLDNGEEDFK